MNNEQLNEHLLVFRPKPAFSNMGLTEETRQRMEKINLLFRERGVRTFNTFFDFVSVKFTEITYEELCKEACDFYEKYLNGETTKFESFDEVVSVNNTEQAYSNIWTRQTY